MLHRHFAYFCPVSENHSITKGATRAETYEGLLPQIEALTEGEPNLIANLANIASVLHAGLGFFWVGFYRVIDGELVLGPFQGTPACTRIAHGKGVCGTSWAENRSIVVPDVDAFPGHIACSSQSKSEVVIPIHDASGTVTMVLDIDSDILNDFSETDQRFLEQLAAHITTLL